MILVVVLTLASARSYGVSDFFGTLGARRFGVLPATTLTYLWATVALSAGLLSVGGAWSGEAVIWGAVSGVAVVGFVLFYQALTVGPVSVLSPVIGLLVALYSGTLAVVGVLVALYPVATILLSIAVLGERLTLPQSIGVGTALASSALFALG